MIADLKLKELQSSTLDDLPKRRINQSVESVLRVGDVVGSAVQRVKTYNELDNKKQMVALINDVSIVHELCRV